MDSQKHKRKGKEYLNSNFFILSNNIFNLKLDAYEFMVYSYMVSLAGKKNECWPSFNTMSRMLGMSTNTIIKKVDSLVAKQLIQKEHKSMKCKNGKVRTSNNHYIILPFEKAWDYSFRFDHSNESV